MTKVGEQHQRADFGASGSTPVRGRENGGLLPRARFTDVLLGRASLVGSRLSNEGKRGWISPVEPRIHLGIPYGDLRAEESGYLKHQNLLKNMALVVRTGVARLLAPSKGKRLERRPRIVSATVDNISIEDSLDAIFAPPKNGKATIVYIVHPHALNLASFMKSYAEQLTYADFVFPDGIGIRVAASILGISLQHNINGTDLLPFICRRAVDVDTPLVLLGGAPGVANECADRLRESTPGLRIPLIINGYLTDEGSQAAATQIKGLGRCVVLVGMGSPLQEIWTWKYLRDAPNATVVTVGGLFDFFSGRIPRAPMAWRELGIEWLWRLRMEPRRLAKRYLIGNPLFLLLALKQRITESLGVSSTHTSRSGERES